MKDLIKDINQFYDAVSYMSTRTETGNRQPLVSGIPFNSVDPNSQKITKYVSEHLENSKINLILPKK